MNLKTKLVVAGGAVLALAGAGAALAGSGQGSGGSGAAPTGLARGGATADAALGHGFGPGARAAGLQAASDYLGVAVSTLRTDLRSGKTLAEIADATGGKSAAGLVDALVADAKAKLAAAVGAGRLTQAQADAVSANLMQRITDRVNATRPAVPNGPRGLGPGRHGDIQAAADYLGVTVAALVAHEKSELAAAVAAGKLTQAQSDAIAANLQQRVTDRVNGTRPIAPAGPRGHLRGGWGAHVRGGWGARAGGGTNA